MSDAGASDAGLPANPPDAPTLGVRAEPTEVRVGDVITVTITAVALRAVPVNLPAQVDPQPFAVLDRKEEEKDLGDGHRRRTFTLQVAVYETGDLTLPPVPLTYIGKGGAVLTAHTEPVPIRVRSLIANEPEPQLKDNAPPVPVLQENRWLYRGLAGAGLLAVGGVLGIVLWRRMKARAAIRPAPPPRPAHEIALERLDRLGAAGFLENADYRPFYFTLSEIIRDYVGARFGFDSLELTTEELMFEVRRLAPRELELGELESWLSAGDLVKFAKVAPTATEARGAFETALRIVTSTRPRPEPVVAAAQTGAPADG